MDQTYPYIASLTREPFLFYEMRVTAELMVQGLNEKDSVQRIVEENLFQYPTEKSLPRMARCCIKRLQAMEDTSLIAAIAENSTETAKQVCLYAMMKQSRLIWEFMITVIGEKYRLQDTSFGRLDLNVFFMALQEQSIVVAGWKEATIQKLKQVITKMLVETGYLDTPKSDHLNQVWLDPILYEGIKRNHDEIVLSAFNFFE